MLVSEGKIYARLLGFLQKIHLQNLICHSITRSVAVTEKSFIWRDRLHQLYADASYVDE